MASLSQGVQSVEPGGQVVFTLEVRNLSDVVDELSIEVLGDAGAWAEVQPPRVNLMPGTPGVATIRIRPPRTAQVRSGWVNFGVGIRSRQHPEGSIVERAAIDVAPFVDYTVELAPRVAKGSREATFVVRARNDGNTPLALAFAADDPEQALNFAATPSSLALAPGDATVASLKVRARQTFLLGGARSRQFQVRVIPTGQPLRLLDGTFVQRARLPMWVPVALTALAVAGAASFAVLAPRFGSQPGTPTPSLAAAITSQPSSSPAESAPITAAPASSEPSPSPSPPPLSPSPSPSPTPAPTSIAAALAGTWKNVDPNANGIVEIDFSGPPDTLMVRAWGACSPSPCDWGTQSVPAPTSSAAFDVQWTFSFAVVTQHQQLEPDGTLTVTSMTHFTDSSGRADYTATEHFAKAP